MDASAARAMRCMADELDPSDLHRTCSIRAVPANSHQQHAR